MENQKVLENINSIKKKIKKDTRIIAISKRQPLKRIIDALDAEHKILPNVADDFFNFCKNDLKLKIKGLMCIPPYADDPTKHFAYLKKKSLEYKLPYLSMGMSGDYQKAITFGATHIRVGTRIFGERPKN